MTRITAGVRTSVDVHSHHVPTALLEVARNDGGRHGVNVSRDDTGRWMIGLGGAPDRMVPPPLVDPKRCLEQMEEQGLGFRIISGWNEVFGYELDPRAASWWCAAQNSALAEVVAEAPGRVAALATVPLQDPVLAARELGRAVGECGLRGALIGTHVRGVNLDAETLNPFWEAACENAVPVMVHPGTAALDRSRFSDYFMANSVGNPTETTLAAAALAFGGVLERFPELNVVLVHGGGFFPYQVGRLWKAFTVRDEVPKSPGRDPLAAVGRFYYDTILHYQPALQLLVAAAGVDRLLFGTDSPFEMAEHRPPADWLGPALPDPEALAAVSGGNARRLFSLENC